MKDWLDQATPKKAFKLIFGEENKMGIYFTSTGEKLTQSQVERKIRFAKAKKITEFIEENGHVFCEDCKRSDKHPIDCSHDISVAKCKEMRQVELAWDVNNIKLRCRDCHEKKDKLNIQSSKIK